MTTARIIGIHGIYTVDVDPMSDASLMTVARTIRAEPGERVEITFDPSTNAGTRTYFVREDLTLAYLGRTFGSAKERRDWLRSQAQSEPAPKRKRFDLWQWVLDRWARQ